MFAMFALVCPAFTTGLAALPPAQQAYFKASNAETNDNFGWSVAVSGNTAVVGALLESSNATGINGDQSDNSAPQAGAAYVFVREGTNWVQQAYLKASNPGGQWPGEEFGDLFGWAIAISGDTLVVGAPYEDSNATGIDGDQTNNDTADSGAAYVFVRNGTNWVQQAYLKASNPGNGDHFGHWVAISGDTVVVGAPFEDSNARGVNGNQDDNSLLNSGAAYVFARDGTNWAQQAYLKASNTGGPSSGEAFGDNFGVSVGISGDTVVVGSVYEDSNAKGVNGNQSNDSALQSGAAYVFVRSGTNWSQQAYLKASNTGSSDEFGWAVAISGDTVAAGAAGEGSDAVEVNGDQNNNRTPGAGAVYVFVRQGTNWLQQAYLKASSVLGDDGLGFSVALSGDVLVAGAPGDDNRTPGINPGPSDESAFNAGAAYVFVREGTNWTQRAYLKGSNTAGPLPGEDYGDDLGADHMVAVSGDTVIVGGHAEDSNGIGVNGNQTERSARDSGAAYVFTGFAPGPRLGLAAERSSGFVLSFIAVPDVTYRLQRAHSVSGPWDTISTNKAPASGVIEYRETTPPMDAAFYRSLQL
ncbi:MAG: integrin [Verrucomicrobiota bacterium]